MVRKWAFFLSIYLSSGLLQGQDERYYRKLLKGELPRSELESGETPVPQFNVNGPSYRIDLNGDKIEEIISPQKRDGVDWIEIRNSSETILFEAELLPSGYGSHLYKIRFIELSPNLKALILFLDEGATRTKRLESTARLFVISFENNDLTKMSIQPGPHYFHEKKSQREQYWRRDYSVNVYDVDGDGVKEIAVMYNHIQRFMKYVGKGVWKRF